MATKRMSAQVQIYIGPARCGKTQRLLKLYRQRLSESLSATTLLSGSKCCWLAPNQNAVMQLLDGLMEKDAASFLRPNLFTFANFAEKTILGSRRRIRPISAIQKRRLLQHVIRDALRLGKLEHFARVATTPGFVFQVDEFIAELKRTDTWPEEFAHRCAQRPRGDRRSRELSLLYSAYQQLLQRGELYDSEGRFWAAREILVESAAAISQQFDLVVVNGFNDFTAAQYDILRLLGESCSRLVISLTGAAATGAGSLLFSKTRRTLVRLQEIFPQLEIESLQAPPADKYSLGNLQRQLFREEEILQPAGGSRNTEPEDERPIEGVEILAASSELGEIEAIAERIKALLLTGGGQPQEVLVVCRGGESAITLINAVFADYGIPFASELRPSLETAPVVRSLQTLLHLHEEDWPFQTLLDVVTNRLFAKSEATFDATNLAIPPRVALERCLRSAQLPAGKEVLLAQLEYRRDVAAPEDGGAADKRGSEVSRALSELRWLDKLLATLPVEASIGDWIQTLEQMLAQLGVFLSRAGVELTWKQLCRGMREIEQVDAWSQSESRLLSLAEVQDLIATVAHELRVPATHDTAGRVRILSAESARKLTTKHLFLAGLGEQSFSSANTLGQPTAADDSPPIAEEPISEEVPETETETDVGRSDAMLLFYELVTRPTDSLTMSYSALDAKGQPLSPSPLLHDLERSVSEGRVVHRAMALGAMSLGHGGDRVPYSLGDFRRQAVAQALDGEQRGLAGMISHPNFVRTGSSILGGIDCVAGRSVRDSYGPYEGLLLSDAAQAALAQRYDAKHLWSPSRLENYAACPFRYFAEQLLGLEPLLEMTVRNDPRRRGSLLHLVLATIHEQLSSGETASEVDTGELVERFLKALEMAVKASPLRGIAHSLREIERREIEAWASDYAEQEISYRDQWQHLDEPPRPAHFEVRFGPETRHHAGETADRSSTALPFELDLGDERICLTGAIDRVDIGRIGDVTVFNIIDYKSGQEVKLKLDKVSSGHQLQLPLYALAAEQLLLADQGAVALATGYWNIQGKGFDGKRGGSLQLRELVDQALVTSDDWKRLQPEIMARVQQLISGIREGQFPVYNENEQCTRSCSLSTVCRVAQIRSLEKTWPAAIEAS